MPPHWRSPQIPWFTETGTPNLNPFSPLLLAIPSHQIVGKLQLSFYLDLLFPEIYNSLGSFWLSFLKIACLHVSFTAYENFYKLSKMKCLLILFSTFYPSEVSENRNLTIKHISTYTLFHPSISTYVVDHFLVISCT